MSWATVSCYLVVKALVVYLNRFNKKKNIPKLKQHLSKVLFELLRRRGASFAIIVILWACHITRWWKQLWWWGIICIIDGGGGQVMVVVVESNGGSRSEVVVVDDNDDY